MHKLASKTGLLSSMLANFGSPITDNRDIQLQGIKWHTVSVADPARMKCNFDG